MDAYLKKAVLFVKRYDLFPGVRRFAQQHFDLTSLRTIRWEADDPFDETMMVSDYQPDHPWVLGIVKEFWHNHRHFIAACRELRVAYKVLDLSQPDWLQAVEESGCHAFLVVPSIHFSVWKQMYDERVRMLSEVLGKVIFPSYEALWMWESKRRMHYWLKSMSVPHPRTWVFYDRQRALDFADEAALPIVYKSDMGSGASGVKVFRERGALRSHVKRCFDKGYTNYRRGPNDKEIGSILLQEFLPEAREWRVVRIGESYFGFEKLRVGDFHSGTHLRSYDNIPDGLFDFARSVFDAGKFNSMSLDIFLANDGRFLVNELQTYFGIQDNHEMCIVDGQPGRMLYDARRGVWRFEPGSFCQNFLYNQRVLCALNLLDAQASRS